MYLQELEWWFVQEVPGHSRGFLLLAHYSHREASNTVLWPIQIPQTVGILQCIAVVKIHPTFAAETVL